MSGRGSRAYRQFTYDKVRPIKTLWEQLELEKEDDLLWCGMHLWGVRELSSEVRQFIFRWNQGMVHGNTVISHFGDVDRKCTFCKLVEGNRLKAELGRDLTEIELSQLNVVDETRAHIFWDCHTVQRDLQCIYKSVWDTGVNVTKRDYLMGLNIGNMEATILYMSINMLIKYKIWRAKLANTFPNCNTIANDIKMNVYQLTKYQKWRNMLPLVRQRIPR